jgi:hypothetical protein
MLKFMSKMVVVSWLVFPIVSQASVVQPPVGKPACFKRVYSDEHMKRHPKQKLSSLYIQVQKDQWKFGDEEEYSAPGAKLVGVSKGQYFVNNNPGCTYEKDGSTRCSIECDGGAFNLKPRKSGVMFSVQDDYYFPLFKNGTDQETATEQDMLSLDWIDEENRNYLLYQVPTSECEAAQERAKVGEWGC